MTLALESRLNETIHDIALSRSPQGGDVKTQSLLMLTDMCLEQVRLGARALPDQFGALMAGLLPRVSADTRALVSRRLAHTHILPRRVLELLMADDPAVSGPVLRQSPLFTRDDLVSIARGASAEKAHQISGRTDLSQPVLAALIDRRDADIATEIALSEKITLSASEADRLASIPGLSGKAADRLAEVAGLSDEALLTLFWEISPERRQLVLERVSRRRDHIAVHGPSPSRPALGEELIRLAATRRRDELGGRLAGELRLPTALADRIVDDEAGEALVVAGRAARLSVEHATGLVLLASSRAAEDIATLRTLAHLAFRLEPAIASVIVEVWRRLEWRAGPTVKHEAAVARPPEKARASGQAEPRRLESIVAEYAARRG